MGTSTSRPKTETIVGLDLGTKCGWAVLRGRKRLDSGRWPLMKSGNHRATRWLNLESNLKALVEEHNPQVIAFERVRRHLGTTAAHVYGGLLASLERLDMQWYTHALHNGHNHPEITPIEISTWRKAACGAGNVDKLFVEKWVKRRFKYTAHNDDEAEALAIAEAIRRIRRGQYKP